MIANFLLLILSIPLFGFCCVLYIDEHKERNIQNVSIWTSVCALFCFCSVLFMFKESCVFSVLSLSFIIDKISLLMMLMSSFIIFMSLLIARNEIKICPKIFHLSVLGLEAILFLLFASKDVIAFYILLQLSVIILFILLKIFTQDISFRFFVQQIISAIVLLFGIAYTIHITGITDINVLAQYTFSEVQEKIIFWSLFIAFVLQASVFPMHLCAVESTVEAPSSLGIIFNGIFFKLGIFFIIYILLQIAPHACALYQMLIISYGLFSICGCICRLIFQHNLKYAVAYVDAIATLIILLGAFTLNTAGICGALLSISAYGVTVSGLIFFTYLLEKYYDNCTTKLSAIIYLTPLLGISGEVLILSIVMVPLLPCFSGVFTILFAYFDEHLIVTCLLGALILISVFFEFAIFQKVIFGEKIGTTSIFKSETYLMIPFVVLILIMGFLSNPLYNFLNDAISETSLRIYKNVAI